MRLRYSFRAYPTPAQRIALAGAFGCARVVYNDTIRMREDAQAAGLPYPSDAACSKALTVSKKTPQRSWLASVSSVVLQQAVADANTAYRNFFNSINGKRKGPKVAPPRFKSRRDSRQAIRFTRNSSFKIRGNGRLRLPKVGDVKITWTRRLPADPSSVTVIKDASGRYFCSFVVEAGNTPLPPVELEIGVDLGLTHFAITSDGTKITNPRHVRKAEAGLKRLQRALARKKKGSANRAKARVRVARAHVRIADRRRDFLHKLSTRLVRENQTIMVEKLNTRGLARTRLAKSVHDAGWGMFVSMLAYKAERAQRVLVRVDPAYTSQTCSACGVLDGPKPLNVRQWTCTACGAVHDRDVNAARNVLAAGRVERLNACGARVRPGLVPAPRVEAGTHPGVTGAATRTRDAEGIPCL